MKAPTMNTVVLEKQKMLKQNADIRGGRDPIILNRDLYFVRLDNQTDDQFNAMVSMAPVYVLFPKIVDAFTGIVFSKDPTIYGVESNDLDYLENIDLLGNSLDGLSEKVLSQVFENGFCATYNDYSEELSAPFVQFVPASAFISFKVTNVSGKPTISQFIYTEETDVDDPEDEFATDTETNFIVLDLYKQSDDTPPIYRIRVLTEDENGEVRVKSEEFPRMNGAYFDYIPIQIHGIDANNYTIKKSPLQDLSDMNISIMQRVVDQVYMLHWTALPTPWVTGVDDDSSPTTIGSSVAWRISNSDSRVGMLEFTGQSAQAHQDFVENLKDIMASTGAQILKKEGISRETATSVLVRNASQTSLISRIVSNVSSQVKATLAVQLEWSGISTGDDFDYTLNEDFIRVDMEPNAQIALVKSWLDGAISHKTLFKKMKEGELIEPNKTFEDELEDIEESPPPFYLEALRAEEAEKARVAEAEAQEKADALSGSNLENGNVPNKQAGEQV